MLSDLIGDKVSQFLSSKCKGAYGVCGKGVGDGVESIYFQHRKPNCKAAYLFLISLTLRCYAKERIYFRVTQAFPKDILHIGP